MSSISSFLKFLNYFWGPTNFLLLTKPISNISFLLFQEPVCYVTLHDFFNDVKSWVVPNSVICTNWSQAKISALMFSFHGKKCRILVRWRFIGPSLLEVSRILLRDGVATILKFILNYFHCFLKSSLILICKYLLVFLNNE